MRRQRRVEDRRAEGREPADSALLGLFGRPGHRLLPRGGKGRRKEATFAEGRFDPYEAAEGTHAAVVVSEWEEVRTQELEHGSALMQEPKVLVDGRNPFEPAAPREAGASGALGAAMRRRG